MQFSQAVIAAAVAFLPAINAHLTMVTPLGAFLPAGTLKDPLLADGSNFPCKFPGGAAPGPLVAGSTLTVGGPSTVQIKGSAVHSGGSCQISITYDNPPTKASVFKVLKSFHGGCPTNVVGNLPDAQVESLLPDLQFDVLKGLKNGGAVLAWTWFNKSGNREMYMNCAAVTIAGGDATDTVSSTLPDMFVANAATPNKDGSTCSTAPELDLIFPNPGVNVFTGGAGTTSPPVCGAKARRHIRQF